MLVTIPIQWSQLNRKWQPDTLFGIYLKLNVLFGYFLLLQRIYDAHSNVTCFCILFYEQCNEIHVIQMNYCNAFA